MAEHILATCAYDREEHIDVLIFNTLRAVYRAPGGWNGKDIWDAATMVRLERNFNLRFCYHLLTAAWFHFLYRSS